MTSEVPVIRNVSKSSTILWKVAQVRAVPSLEGIKAGNLLLIASMHGIRYIYICKKMAEKIMIVEHQFWRKICYMFTLMGLRYIRKRNFITVCINKFFFNNNNSNCQFHSGKLVSS